MRNDVSLSTERLLSRSEVETIFGFPTRRYLEIAATRGDGPPMIRFGRTVRYRVCDLREWIETRRVASTSETGRAEANRVQPVIGGTD